MIACFSRFSSQKSRGTQLLCSLTLPWRSHQPYNLLAVMSSHPMNRPAPISVFADQRRTKSTIWSRVSWGTQTPVRVPQLFFLGQRVPPSVRPKPHPSSGSSFPDRRFVPVRPDGWSVLSSGKPPLRSRRTPPASGRTRSAGAPVRHTDPRSALLPPNASSELRPSLPACSASVASSCVRSVTLTEKRFFHFQLRQDSSDRLAIFGNDPNGETFGSRPVPWNDVFSGVMWGYFPYRQF